MKINSVQSLYNSKQNFGITITPKAAEQINAQTGEFNPNKLFTKTPNIMQTIANADSDAIKLIDADCSVEKQPHGIFLGKFSPTLSYTIDDTEYRHKASTNFITITNSTADIIDALQAATWSLIGNIATKLAYKGELSQHLEQLYKDFPKYHKNNAFSNLQEMDEFMQYMKTYNA